MTMHERIGRALALRLRALDVERPEDERFWRPNVSVIGDLLHVQCHRRDVTHRLTLTQAAHYLAWLEAGHVGNPDEWTRATGGL